MRVFNLGVLSFEDAYALQEWIAGEIAAETAPETLFLLEHYPVYTSGRGGAADNVKNAAIKLVYTNRGGDVTWHGPGQLIAYPLLDLRRRKMDLHAVLRFLEEVVIATAGRCGVAARRNPGSTGVWTDSGKLASIGIGVRRCITMHGTAINVSCEDDGFRYINPCGIRDCPIATLERETGRPIPLPDVKKVYLDEFSRLLEKLLPQE